jgi:hypothetical protein
MNPIDPRSEAQEEYMRTLHLLTQVEPPKGLAERVQSRLEDEPRRRTHRGLLHLFDPLTPWGNWMRGLAAAAIVAILAGGCWEVFSRSHAPAVTPSASLAAPSTTTTGNGFTSAGAVRKPQTLDGPLARPENDPAKSAVKAKKNTPKERAARNQSQASAIEPESAP